MEWHAAYDIGWHWLWIPIAIFVIFASVLFAGRYRRGYVAICCILLMGVAPFLWVRNGRAQDNLGLHLWRRTPTAWEGRSVTWCNGEGGVGFEYFHTVDEYPDQLSEQRASAELFLQHRSEQGYPTGMLYPAGWKDAVVHSCGFRLFTRFEPPRPGHFWTPCTLAIAFPNWFAIAIVAMGPVFWANRRFIRPWRRRRQNRCLACGYLRHGLPPDRACPECGLTPSAARLSVP